MTDQVASPAPALAVALAYHEAWTSGDVEDALRHVADDVVCDAPSGQLKGMGAYRPFIANFAPRVTGFDMIAALADGETAVLVYDLHTVAVSSALVCECFTVEDGKITHDRLIFDQTPYAAAARASGSS
jgi:limonene-1,2-epoxide hydrolase